MSPKGRRASQPEHVGGIINRFQRPSYLFKCLEVEASYTTAEMSQWRISSTLLAICLLYGDEDVAMRRSIHTIQHSATLVNNPQSYGSGSIVQEMLAETKADSQIKHHRCHARRHPSVGMAFNSLHIHASFHHFQRPGSTIPY